MTTEGPKLKRVKNVFNDQTAIRNLRHTMSVILSDHMLLRNPQITVWVTRHRFDDIRNHITTFHDNNHDHPDLVRHHVTTPQTAGITNATQELTSLRATIQSALFLRKTR
ncbi:hypothetical protein E4U15_004187 [Claviceps sp. LM218 group G6]|nr:hypothetical protein E4U15_004187 [Claviceps sp. LM218 group G6]